MFKKEKIFSFSGAFLLMAVLINVLIIKTAYIKNEDFYWSLLFSIPPLGFGKRYTKPCFIFSKTLCYKGIHDPNMRHRMATNLL